MAVGYRWYVGDLRTGKIYRQVDLQGARWSTSFDYAVAGSIEGSFPLRSVVPEKVSHEDAQSYSDLMLQADTYEELLSLYTDYDDLFTGETTYSIAQAPAWPNARADTTPGKSFLAVSYMDALGNETFLEAGPIWARRFNDKTGVLQIGASGLASYFDERKVVAASFEPGDDVSILPVTLEGAQLGIIAKQLVELAGDIVIDGETPGALPIVLPDDADLGGLTPVNHTRTYFGYELGWVGERLKQLTQVEDGPEIQFVPRRRTDDPRFIEWEMQIGVEADDMMLAQSGRPWVFDRTAAGSDVRDIDVDDSGKGIAQRVWAAGEGEAEGRPIVVADNTDMLDLGYPLMEGEVRSTDTVSETETLQGHANEELSRGSRPSEAWSITVSRDGRPNVGQYRAGSWSVLRVRDHDYLADGDYDMRILAVSGSGDDHGVRVTLAERRDA